MNFRRLGLGIALLASSPALVACQKLTNVRVQPATATLEGAGQTSQFRASQLDAKGAAMKKEAPVTWASDNPAVATVDGQGLATGKKTGRATITATAGATRGQATVEVHVPGKITGQDVSLGGAGQSQQVSFQVVDESGQPMPSLASSIQLAVEDQKVATVAGPQGGSWTVTGVGAGQTKLIASAGKLSQPFSVSVKAPEISEVKLNQAGLKLKPGQAQKLAATVMAGAKPVEGVAVTFASSDPKVATVDADGTIHAVAKGKATITAAAGAKTAAASVVVSKK